MTGKLAERVRMVVECWVWPVSQAEEDAVEMKKNAPPVC